MNQIESFSVKGARAAGQLQETCVVGKQARGGGGRIEGWSAGVRTSAPLSGHSGSVRRPAVVTVGLPCESATMTLVRRVLTPSGSAATYVARGHVPRQDLRRQRSRRMDAPGQLRDH